MVNSFKYFLFFLVCVFISFSCSELFEPTKVQEKELSLKANIYNGVSPLKVTLTGNLIGKIDSMKMFVPAKFVFGKGGRKVLIYTLPDTLINAQRTYVDTALLDRPGVYKISMLLREKYRNIISDTISIIAH